METSQTQMSDNPLKIISADTLDTTLENASAPKKVFEHDQSQLPKRWIPKWVVRIIECTLLPFVVLDQLAKSIARFILPPPFKKVGKCKKRGNCCQFIVMRQSRGFMGYIEHFWATQINGFYPRKQETIVDEKARKVIVMGCRYLSKSGKCTNYLLRPQVCRTWPVIEHFGEPRILKGCGYKALNKETGSFVETD